MAARSLGARFEGSLALVGGGQGVRGATEAPGTGGLGALRGDGSLAEGAGWVNGAPWSVAFRPTSCSGTSKDGLRPWPASLPPSSASPGARHQLNT